MLSNKNTKINEKNDLEGVDDVAFGFGEIHEELFEWAKEGDLTDIVYACCHAIGLSPTIKGFGNLIQELDDGEVIEILSKIIDEPIAYELKRLVNYYRSTKSKIIFNPLKKKDINKIPGDQKKPLFFLTLFATPVVIVETEKRYGFKVLKIWLLIHAIKRVPLINSHDGNIESVANYLRRNLNIIKQVVINTLMEKSLYQTEYWSKWGFWRINSSIISAANYIKEIENNKNRESDNDIKVIKAIISIASGKLNPVNKNKFSIKRNNSRFQALKKLPLYDLITEDEPSLKLLKSNVENDQDELCLVDVTDAKSFAEQEVISRSVFLQRAIAAHYLPWEWNKPLPPERIQLNEWIDKSLRSESLVNKLGAAIVWISLNIGRSLHFTSRLKVTDEIHNEWSISSCYTKLHRKVPMRHGAWNPVAEDNLPVKPFEELLELSVPKAIVAVMKDVEADSNTNQSETLEQLWKKTNEQKIVEWFNRCIKIDIRRISSGKLTEHLGQNVFEKSGDHRLARLIESHPDAGLSAACGYGSWDVEEVGKYIDLTTNYTSPQKILLGSRLNPYEESILNEIRIGNDRLEQLSKTNLIDFHNGYAQYCINALYAGTGGRPLDYPFESINHFNLKHKFVYINDKSDVYLHDGRVVPLAEKLVLLINDYLEHLELLASKLDKVDEVLAQQIIGVKNGECRAMPLFFQLKDDLSWTGIKQELPRVGRVFNWNLPDNFFRHRYSQQLTKMKVSPEVIDAWMGHGERGATTYSEDSLRCILEDFKMYQKEINHVYDSLEFTRKICVADINKQLVIKKDEINNSGNKDFGLRLRKKNQKRRIKEIIDRAKATIDSFLNGRRISEISSEQMDELTSIMLTCSNGLPHTERRIRYEVLIKRIKEEGSQYYTLIKSRIVKYPRPRSVLSEKTPSNFNKFEEIKKWKINLTKTIDKSKLSKRECLFYSTLILIVEKRITYKRMLFDICNGKNFRLVKFDSKYYIEYSEELDINNIHSPVQRHQISSKTCAMLSNGKTLNIKRDTINDKIEIKFFSNKIVSLIEEQQETAANIISEFVNVVMHANELEFPGIVAASLSGKILPTSLSWYDKIRIEKSELYLLSSSTLSKDDEISETRLITMNVIEKDEKALKVNAEEFCKKVSEKIDFYQKSNINTFVKEIEILIVEYSRRVSRAVILLAEWIVHITKYGTSSDSHRKLNKKRYLAKNTIKTYFSTLSMPIKGLAYNIDIFSLDSDEITELYQNMLLYKQEKNNQITYFGERLRSFHTWASRLGISDPNWGDLDFQEDIRHVRPGYISEEDYQQTLRYLKSTTVKNGVNPLFLQFTLLLCYRFGLRTKEAIGIKRCDWKNYNDQKYVIVDNNKFRMLKTSSSRRVVPLLFELDKYELQIIEDIETHHAIFLGDDHNTHLMSDVNGSSIEITQYYDHIASILIQALRSVTQNPLIVLHHCRHTFFSRIAIALFDLDSISPIDSYSIKDKNAEINKLLLGTDSSKTKRTTSALALTMGHYYVKTGLKSYFHLMTEWLDFLTPIDSIRERSVDVDFDFSGNSIINRKHYLDSPISIEVNYKPITPYILVQLLRLVSCNQSFKNSGKKLHLDPFKVAAIQDYFLKMSAPMRLNDKKDPKGWVKAKYNPYMFLQKINNRSWSELINFFSKTDVETICNTIKEFKGVDFTAMISRNRQILIANSKQCDYVSWVLDLLAVPRSLVKAVAINDNEYFTSLILTKNISIENHADKQIDPLLYMDRDFEKDFESRRKEYAALLFKRNNEFFIRNSYEFALCFVLLSCYIHILELD